MSRPLSEAALRARGYDLATGRRPNPAAAPVETGGTAREAPTTRRVPSTTGAAASDARSALARQDLVFAGVDAREPLRIPGIGHNRPPPERDRAAFREVALEMRRLHPLRDCAQLRNEDALQARIMRELWRAVASRGWAVLPFSINNAIKARRRRLPDGRFDPRDKGPMLVGLRLNAMGLLAGVNDVGLLHVSGVTGYLEVKYREAPAQARLAVDRGRIKAKPPSAGYKGVESREQRLFARLCDISGAPRVTVWSVDEALAAVRGWWGAVP